MVLKAMRGKLAPARNPEHLKTEPPKSHHNPLGLGEIKELKKKRGSDAFYEAPSSRGRGENVGEFNSEQEEGFKDVAGKHDECNNRNDGAVSSSCESLSNRISISSSSLSSDIKEEENEYEIEGKYDDFTADNGFEDSFEENEEDKHESGADDQDILTGTSNYARDEF